MNQYKFISDLRNSGASWEQVAAAFSKAYQKTNAECVRKLFSRLKRGVEPPPPPQQVVHGRRPKSPTIKEDNTRILLISDMHVPYQHPDTVAFLTAVKAKYKPTRGVCVGDEVDCFPESSEILTERGWMTFRAVLDSSDLITVAQWDEDERVSFVKPLAYVDKAYDGDLLRIEHRSYLSLTTPKHAIVKLHPVTGKAHRREAWDSEGTDSWAIPRFGVADGPGIPLTDEQIRLVVAFQADGCLDRKAAKFGLTKQRKITRLRTLLTQLNLSFTEVVNGRGDTVLRILTEATPAYLTKQFPAEWIGLMSAQQRAVFLNELVHWDGTETGVGVRYVSTMPENVAFVHALAISSGKYVSKVTDNYVDIHWERTEQTSQKSASRTLVPYKGQVCCVQVPSGMIIVRQEGVSTVTGNCHAMSFHDSDPNLVSAGDELNNAIEALQPIYKLFPNMDLVDSNHGSMVYRKGKVHGIPRKYIRDYGDVLDAPTGWNWHMELLLDIPGGNQLLVHHGLSKDVMKVVAQRGMCVVQGHYHTEFRIGYLGNPNHLLWGMNIGCSIDSKSLAFAYDRNNLGRPVIGHGIVIDGLPHLLPMILDSSGKWIGVVP